MNKYYINFAPLFDKPYYKNITYLNSYDEALRHLSVYKCENKIPVHIPIRIQHTFIPVPKIYLDKVTGLIANDRSKLIKHIMWMERLPGTITVPLVASIVGLGYWALP